MGKNKTKLVIGILILLIVAVGGLFGYKHYTEAKNANQAPSIDEIVKNLTVATDEMTTNLADNSFIKIQFTIQVSNEQAKNEAEKRMFQIQNEILYQLSGMKSKDLEGSKGMNDLESSLKKRINGILTTGKVTRVYTTEKVIQ